MLVSRNLARRGFSYEPVTIAADRDEGVMYGVRARAAYLGEWRAGDVSVAENENSPSLLPLLNPVIMGGLGRILGSLEAAFIASDFLFPPLIFFALYLLAFELTRRRLLAAWFASAFIFMPKIFLLSGFARELLPDPANRLYFSRFEYPKITYLLFTIALYLVLRTLTRGEKYAPLIAGATVGLVFYTYLYDWVYVFAGLGLTLFFLVLQKDYGRVKRVLAVIGVGFLASVFYWINFFELRGLPQYGDLVNRIGVEIGNGVRWATAWKSYLRAAALSALVWWVWRKRDRAAAAYLAGLLLVIAIVLNLQVVLGFNPQPDHWHRIQFLPVGLGMLALLHGVSQKYFRTALLRYGGAVGGALIFLIFGKAAYAQYAYSAQNAERYAIPADRAASYAWLRANAAHGAVVASNSLAASAELSLYVGSKVFVPNGFNTTISEEEIWQRAMIMSRIFGLSEKEFSDFIKNPGTVSYLFTDQYRDRSFDSYFRDANRQLSDSVYQKRMQEYKTYLQVPINQTMRYRLDYLYYGLGEGELGKDPVESLPHLKKVKKVYEKSQIRIYQVQ